MRPHGSSVLSLFFREQIIFKRNDHVACFVVCNEFFIHFRNPFLYPIRLQSHYQTSRMLLTRNKRLSAGGCQTTHKARVERANMEPQQPHSIASQAFYALCGAVRISNEKHLPGMRGVQSISTMLAHSRSGIDRPGLCEGFLSRCEHLRLFLYAVSATVIKPILAGVCAAIHDRETCQGIVRAVASIVDQAT